MASRLGKMITMDPGRDKERILMELRQFEDTMNVTQTRIEEVTTERRLAYERDIQNFKQEMEDIFPVSLAQ